MPTMALRNAPGWQLILADLSLILFLVTVAALAEQSDDVESQPASDVIRPDANVAPAQALFRPSEGGPSMAQWLETQTRDPRATLSVIALHRVGEERMAWGQARALADEARRQGVTVRIVVQEGNEADLYASLAFDSPR